MKVIALVPIKNESWILPIFLKSIKKYVDEVIMMDDNSTDDSISIAESFGVKIFKNSESNLTYFSEYNVRETLLKIGRKEGGTHFVFLDADEAFSSDIEPNWLREKMSSLKPGDKLFFQWIPLWKSFTKFREDKRGMFKKVFKDVIFCDDGFSKHNYAYIGVSRTPGEYESKSCIYIKPDQGVLLHFQYLNWNRNQYKQAWYKCSELLKTERSARRINATYNHLSNKSNGTLHEVPIKWIIELPQENLLNEEKPWYEKNILSIFKDKGIHFFEDIDIWGIPSLKEIFIKETGRAPKPKKFPAVILFLNNIKNNIKNL